MIFDDIIHIARDKEINPDNKDRTTIVREIQTKEGFRPCYRTGYVDYCRQTECLWRHDCGHIVHLFEVI